MDGRCNNGGRREGAGRPSKGNVMLQIRTSKATAVALRQRARAKALTMGDYLTELLND